MAQGGQLEYWEVWYPKAGATGIPLARGLLDHTDSLVLHSAPDVLTAEVRDERGNRLAFGQDLERTQPSPMCRLSRQGDRINREDIWPTPSDIESIVLLPGGEVGVLKAWWHAADKKEWRWQIEFYNSLRQPTVFAAARLRLRGCT